MTREISAKNRGRIRLKEISKGANQLYRRIGRKGRGMLRDARDCGRLLNEAKAISKVGKYGSWKKWLYDNFDGSYETSTHYRRVAKEWNSEPAKDARKKGVHFDGIRPFLDFVKDRRINPEKKILTPKQQKDIDYRREILREMFTEQIDELDEWERKMLYENFDHFWFKVYDELKRILLIVYDYDPEWDEEEMKDAEELKREARQKVRRTLNRKY